MTVDVNSWSPRLSGAWIASLEGVPDEQVFALRSVLQSCDSDDQAESCPPIPYSSEELASTT